MSIYIWPIDWLLTLVFANIGGCGCGLAKGACGGWQVVRQRKLPPPLCWSWSVSAATMVSSTPKDDSLLPPAQVSAAGTYTLKASLFLALQLVSDSSILLCHPSSETPLPLSFFPLPQPIGRASRV